MKRNPFEKRKGSASPFFKGVGELPRDFYTHIKSACKKPQKYREPRAFSVSMKYLWDLYLKQDRKCALSGLPIAFTEREGSRGRRCSASLDRKDSKLGYVEGNVHWVHKQINIMKNKYEMARFIELCKLVAERNQ